MSVDMDLGKIKADLKWQNHLSARVISDLNERTDGQVNVVDVLSIARRSNQEEIDLAMGYNNLEGTMTKGPIIFLSTIHDNRNQILIDDDGNYLYTHIPEEFFYDRILLAISHLQFQFLKLQKPIWLLFHLQVILEQNNILFFY